MGYHACYLASNTLSKDERCAPQRTRQARTFSYFDGCNTRHTYSTPRLDTLTKQQDDQRRVAKEQQTEQIIHNWACCKPTEKNGAEKLRCSSTARHQHHSHTHVAVGWSSRPKLGLEAAFDSFLQAPVATMVPVRPVYCALAPQVHLAADELAVLKATWLGQCDEYGSRRASGGEAILWGDGRHFVSFY
eukprot:3359446-Prymnesium_polylepis.1